MGAGLANVDVFVSAINDALVDSAAQPDQSAARALRRDLVRVAKKKGCKQAKCSHWKGGCCRGGRG